MPHYHVRACYGPYDSLDSEKIAELVNLSQWNINKSPKMWGLKVHVECEIDESTYSHRMQQTSSTFTNKKHTFTCVNKAIYM